MRRSLGRDKDGSSRPALQMNRTLVLILTTACLVGCERRHDGKPLVLDWRDAESDITFRVTENPTIAKLNSRLHVQRDGGDRAILIDDAAFSTIAFVRHDRWLLIV